MPFGNRHRNGCGRRHRVRQSRRVDHLELLRQAEGELDIRRIAADLGVANAPAADTLAACETELKITAFFEARAAAEYDATVRELDRLREESAGSAITAAERSFEPHVDMLMADVKGEEHAGRQRLAPLNADRDQAAQQLARFNHNNQILETLPYKNAGLWMGLMIAAPAVEAAASGPIFAAADDLGLLGGWTTGAFLGATNVIAGAGLACARRSLNWAGLQLRVRADERADGARDRGRAWTAGFSLLWGLFLGAASLAAAAVVNFAAMHYRAAAVVDPARALELVAETVRAAPFSVLWDPSSVALAALSGLFVGAAAWKTLSTFGPIPKHRGKALVLDRAERKRLRERRRIRLRLERLGRKTCAAVERQAIGVRTKAQHANCLFASAGILVDQYAGGLQAIMFAHTAAHGRFREANAAIRTEPPPARFRRPVVLDAPSLELPVSLSELVAAGERSAALATAAAAQAKLKARAVIDGAMSRLGVIEAEAQADVARDRDRLRVILEEPDPILAAPRLDLGGA
jgi:hypothetical protein